MKPKTENELYAELQQSIERLMTGCLRSNYALKLEVSTELWTGCVHLKRSRTDSVVGFVGEEYVRDKIKDIKDLVAQLCGTCDVRFHCYDDV